MAHDGDTAINEPKIPFLKFKDLQERLAVVEEIPKAHRPDAALRVVHDILFSLQHGRCDDPKKAAKVAFILINKHCGAYGQTTQERASSP